MNLENPTERDLEKIFNTVIWAQDALKLLCCNGDDATASLAGIFMERACRSGINDLMQIATERPEALYHRASMCADWPGFIPEHKASRDANREMLQLLGLGSAISYKIKDANLGTPLQEFIASMYLELISSRALYERDVSQFGRDALPQWRHEAISLPKLPGSIDCRERWFNCAWAAFEHSQNGQPMAANTHIRAIGIPGAEKRAYNRKQQKLKRLRSKLRQERDLLAKVTPKSMKYGMKGEIDEFNPIESKIEEIEAEELNIEPGEIVERARSSIRDAFLIRINT